MNATFKSGEGGRAARLGYAIAGRGRAGVVRGINENGAIRFRDAVGQIRGRERTGSASGKTQHAMLLFSREGNCRERRNIVSDSDTLNAGWRADLGIRLPLR
jgi:hypothetical protein